MAWVYSLVILVVSSLMYLVSSLPKPDSFNYEKTNNVKLIGKTNRVPRRHITIPEFGHPEPLPVPKMNPMHTPYEKIQQGFRVNNDTKVYSNKFSYEPQMVGHQIIYRELLDCIITYLSIETDGGIPIILRGGVGYRYFVAIAKAKPGEELSGKIRAYCLKKDRNDDSFK